MSALVIATTTALFFVWAKSNPKECYIFWCSCLVAWRAILSSIVDARVWYCSTSESETLDLKYLRRELSSAHAFCRSVKYLFEKHWDQRQRASSQTDIQSTCRMNLKLRCGTCLQLSQTRWCLQSTFVAPH